MTGNDQQVPLASCTPPGSVTVTPRALDYAKQFQASIPPGYIVAFDWFAGGRIKAGKDAPWMDVGPRLDLGAFRNGQIPEQAIDHDKSFSYVVLIAEDVIGSHPQKTIDLDERGNPVLK